MSFLPSLSSLRIGADAVCDSDDKNTLEEVPGKLELVTPPTDAKWMLDAPGVHSK